MKIYRTHRFFTLLIALTLALPLLASRALEPSNAIVAQDAAPKLNRLILADYMMWYQPDVFDGTKTFDVPAAGPYNSDDMGTIQRQLQLAQAACLNGLRRTGSARRSRAPPTTSANCWLHPTAAPCSTPWCCWKTACARPPSRT